VEIMQSLPEPHIECGCRLFLGPAVARFDARAFGPCQRRTRDTNVAQFHSMVNEEALRVLTRLMETHALPSFVLVDP
jgi:hypothetical protein